MPRYKRSAEVAQLDAPDEPQMAPEAAETLKELRNMWEFASLMQWIFLFGNAVKIDEDFDIEDLEHECLLPHPSEKLAQIGLSMLKTVSSHRGLTPEIFAEYTRRQYLAKAPSRNPFGDEEEPTRFDDLDVFTRIRVLQQLSTWTFFNETRIRDRMPEDEDHLSWRIDPIGWDKEDRSYYVLDDNRLYRRSDAPPPPPLPAPRPKPKPKAKKPPKPKSRGTRSSKRFKAESELEDEDEEMADAEAGAQDDTIVANAGDADNVAGDFGFTNNTWECIAITLEDYQQFLSTIFRSRDPNEKQLRQSIESDVLPILEKRAEAVRQKQLKKQRELENLQKMSGAKRSSRLAVKADKEREEREAREAEEKKQRELRMAHEEQDRQRRIEEGHESRRMTREQRLKERETKRILQEEELARLEREGERGASQDMNDAENIKRQSGRQLKSQKEQLQKDLQELQDEEGDWYFDCAVCGLHGENFDDGTHSMACDRCNVWQHSKCHGVTPAQAGSDDFAFVCHACKKKEEDAKKPKIPSLKLGKRSSGSPEAQRGDGRPVSSSAPRDSGLPLHVQRQLDGDQAPPQYPPPQQAYYPNLSHGTNMPPGMPQPPHQAYYPIPTHSAQPRPPQQQWQGSPLPPPRRPSQSGHGGSPSPVPESGVPAHHPHQYQHQYAHQNAVQASGGHPGYHPSAHEYGRSPQSSRQAYPMSSPPPQQYPSLHTQQPSLQRYSPPQPARQPEQPPHRPSSAHLMNGFQSPAKRAPPSSPGPLPTQPTPQPRQSPLLHSPLTSFPPPSNGYAYNAGHSPTKSSPPAQPRPLPRPSSQSMAQSPLQATPSNGHGYPSPLHHFQTPTHNGTAQPAPASATANGVAADGMSGPWPESTKAIPQKHDQNPTQQPLPTSMVSSTPGNGASIIPPNLAPSPVQVAQGEQGSVPVKKE